MKNLKKVAVIALAFTPAIAFAQNATQLFALLTIVQKVLNYLMPIMIILGVLYVGWGIISFVIKTNEEERAAAKNAILYGVIGLFAIVSIWGLVKFLQQTLGVDANATTNLPCVIDTDLTQQGCQS